MRVLVRAYAAVTTLDVAAWISAYDNRLFPGAG
jgi:hypothetical protein